jgi:hypothetical protein
VHLVVDDHGETAFLVVVVVFLPLLVVRLFRIRPRQLIAAISAQERRALIAAWALLFVTGLFLADRILLSGELWSLPIGLLDTIGHPKIVAAFEERIEERGDGDPSLRYVAAVINHYAGNNARAAELYQTLPASYASSAKNQEALKAGRMPAAGLTADELWRGWAGTRAQRWRKIADLGDMMLPGPLIVLSTVLGVGLVLLIGIFIGPPPAAVEDSALSRSGKIASLILPGLYDIRRGHPWRALAMLLLLGALVPALMSQIVRWNTDVPAVGPLSAMSLPALEGTWPLPDMEITSDEKWTMTLAYPHAKLFFALLAVAAVAALALHFSRVRRILGERV